MIFLFYFFVLIVFSLFEVFQKKTNWRWFNIVYAILAGMTIIRYGVGTDFFNYKLMYEETPAIGKGNVLDMYHGEVGYLFFSSLFKTFNFNFWIFNGFVALASMSLFYKGIRKYCIYPFMSLMIFYAIFYFTYPFNAIRHGLTLALFWGILLELLLKKQYFLYYVLILIGSLFHISLVFCVVCPLLFRLKLNFKYFFFGGMVGVLFPLGFFIKNFLPGYMYARLVFYADEELSIWAIIIRLIFAIPILYVVNKYGDNTSIQLRKLGYLYLFGIIVYVSFISCAFVASRLNIYFRLLEMVLLPMFIFCFNNKFNRFMLFVYLSLLLGGVLVKNINMLIKNSLLDMSFWEYPLFYFKSI